MNKIKIGAIGVGDVSQGAHLPGIAASPDLDLWAICDIDEKKLEQVGDRYDIPIERRFTDYNKLLKLEGLDAVDITTPNDLHYGMAMAAIEAGKPYSLEKPVTLSAQQANMLAQASEENNIPNMVCFSYRFKAAARFARYLIHSGEIGEVYHVNMQYLQAWGNPLWNTPLVWRFIKERSGSGALGDLGSHALDLVSFVCGQTYTKVFAHTATFVKERRTLGTDEMGIVDVDDFCNISAQLKNGGAAGFQISRLAYGRGNYQCMEVYGSKGAIIYTLGLDGNDDTLEISTGEAMRQASAFVEVPVPAWYRSDQMQSFADILLGKSDGLAATISDGKENQKVLDAVIESADTGSWVYL